MRQAADRGVTICFADLDGADGLWVPEERTVLVSRRLSEREVAEVIEHELGHVAIDDQHAELDAGVLHPPPASSRRWAAALSAAACLAVIGGVAAGLTQDSPTAVREGPVVAPSAPPLTGPLPGPDESIATQVVIGPDGRIQVRTFRRTMTPTGTTPSTTPARTAASPGTRSPSPQPPRSATPTPTSPAATSADPSAGATSPPPPPAPTTDVPSSAAPAAPAAPAATGGSLFGDSLPAGSP